MRLGGGHYLSVFTVEQLQALALMSLNLNAQAGSISIIIFGLFELVIGCLIFKSTFLWPQLADHVSPYVDGLGFVAEAALIVWLLVMGEAVTRDRSTRCEL